MDLEDALFRFVAGQSAVTQHIGAAPQEVRFYKLHRPQKSKTPAIVQQRGGSDRQATYCKVDGAVLVSLQVDVYAITWAEMAATAKAFYRLLRNGNLTYPVFMGGSGDSPDDGVKVKTATLENEFDSDDTEPGIFRRTQFWSFWIFEP